jgi:hypothetical protein
MRRFTRSTEPTRSAASSDHRTPQYARTSTANLYCANDWFEASRGRLGSSVAAAGEHLYLLGGQVTLPLGLSAALDAGRGAGRQSACTNASDRTPLNVEDLPYVPAG